MATKKKAVKKTKPTGFVTINRSVPVDPSVKAGFYFTVHAANRQVLVTSEVYKRKENCTNGIMSLIKALNGNDVLIIDKTK